MTVNVSYITNRGLKREENEDSLLIHNQVISSYSMDMAEEIIIDNEKVLLVIADGMGGHSKGEVASKFVLTKLKKEIINLNDTETLRNQLQSIKNDLDDFAQNNPEYLNMGTVIAGVLILDTKLIIFNIGDSRVYQNNFGYCEQISEDHSLVYSLYKLGDLEYNQMKDHPKKNVVTSALIANREQVLNTIFIHEVEFLSGNKQLLICSDGIWESMDLQEIENCMRSETVMECLKLKTLASGANDNFSGIYVSIINE